MMNNKLFRIIKFQLKIKFFPLNQIILTNNLNKNNFNFNKLFSFIFKIFYKFYTKHYYFI